MQFESVVNASEGAVIENPAIVLAKLIRSKADDLAYVGIEVRRNGRGYEETGQGYNVSGAAEGDKDGPGLMQGAQELAEAIVEFCSDAQAQFDKPVDWRVTGFDEPDSGKNRQLFQHKFKVRGKERSPTLKETATDSLTATNIVLRSVAEDYHKNVMALATKLVDMITPVSDMTSNIAAQCRPSDAEFAFRTREAEIRRDGIFAQADAESRAHRTDRVMTTLQGIFNDIPMEDLGDSAKQWIELKKAEMQAKERERERQHEKERWAHERAQRERQTPPSSDPPPAQDEIIVDTTATERPTTAAASGALTPSAPNLCEASQTLADIIEGKHEAIEHALGAEDWELVRPLAEQTDPEAFADLARRLRASLEERGALAQTQTFGALLGALNDDYRASRLQKFLFGLKTDNG